MPRKKPLPAANGRSSREKTGPRAAKKIAAAPDAARPIPAAEDFPIVGLGASAGGLEALQLFIANVPAECGMAFVAVTHQHRHHISLLPELLQKRTDMAVRMAENGVQVEPNCIYLSPADGYLDLLAGRLQVSPPPSAESLHLPIDHFFQSLAVDRREKAVGIVLSGTGSDGTLGLRAIRDASGTTLAQEPSSAKFSGMPLSAVEKGLVDRTLAADEMPKWLAQMMAKSHGLSCLGEMPPEEGDLPGDMQQVILLLRSRTGNDFSEYKPSTIRRRIERRIEVHQLRNAQQYLQLLRVNPQEADILFHELLIAVTHFFRDTEAFSELAKTLLPELIASRPKDAPLRVWVPGCATGEEPYSLAIILREAMRRRHLHFKVQIFATDLDAKAIAVARAGLYPAGIARDVSPARLGEYFVKEGTGYQLKKDLRENVIFAVHNVLKDPPFTNLDLIGCRNLLIYFKTQGQHRVLDCFGYALRPGGVLFLGSSESIASHAAQFRTKSSKWKLFIRKPTERTPLPVASASAAARRSDPLSAQVESSDGSGFKFRLPLSSVVEKMLLQSFVPTSVIVSELGEIAYIHGRVGEFLEVASGQPRLNILEMAREGLRAPLAVAMRRATQHKGKVVDDGVRVKTDGHFSQLKVTVSKLTDPMPLRGLLLVTFLLGQQRPPIPVPKLGVEPPKSPRDFVAALERELRFTKDSLQGTVEQLQSANEELQSTNEEMTSSNEELQSVNEELETSKEEMQSLNEELQTVNAQLQAKVEELGTANDDMQNLLNSTEIATIFLDREFRIKRFTSQATKLFNLIPSDLGRPIGDLTSNLRYAELLADAAEVLQKLGLKEREVRLTSGEWRQARIFPYRTMESVVEGLVLTFTDIDRMKTAEEILRARTYAESIVATIREPLVVLDEALRVVSVNRAFCQTFDLSPDGVQGQIIYEAGGGQWSIPQLREVLEKILPNDTTIEDFEIRHTFARVGPKVLALNARRLAREAQMPGMILLAFEDRTSVGDHLGNSKRKLQRP